MGEARAYRETARDLAGLGLLAVLGLAACGRSPPPVAPVPDPVAYSDPALVHAREQGLLQTQGASGGHEIAYLAWRSPETPADTAIIQLPGLTRDAGWLALTALALRDRGYHVYALDHPGQGLNRVDGPPPAENQIDADALLDHVAVLVHGLRRHYDRLFLAGIAWGGRPALAYALRHPDEIDGLILLTPGLAPPALPETVPPPRPSLAARLRPNALLDPLLGRPPTDAGNAAPPLAEPALTATWQDFDATIARAGPGRRPPALLLLAGNDPAGGNPATLAVLARTSGPLHVVTYPDESPPLELTIPSRLAVDIDLWLQTARRSPLRTAGPALHAAPD